MDTKTRIDFLIDEYNTLELDRAQFDAWWRQISHYVVPQYYDYKERQRREQEKLPDDIYMDVARQSLQIFAAGMMGYLTNPASRWFSLGIRNRKLRKNYDVRKYLEEVQELIYDAFTYSNFYAEAKKVYRDLGAFGSANCYAERDKRNVLMYSTYPVLTCYWGTDDQGRVNRVHRACKYTPSQLLARWPKAPKIVYDELKAKGKKEFIVLHIVRPREVFDPAKNDKLNKPFAVYYILKDEKELLEESGLDEFRWSSARFDTVTGETYGYSPAMYALGSIKMSNAAAKTTIEAFQISTRPPLTGRKDLYPTGINMSPGAFNPSYESSSDPTDVLRPINTGANPDAGLKILEWFTNWIKSAFFVDLFLALMDKTKRMTIPEVQEIVSEKMLILGSSLENIMNDFLEPNIEMMYNELSRRGDLPPMPEVMRGVPLTIEYVSPLAKAQKALRAGSIQNLMTIIGNMSTFTPDVLDNFDTDIIAKHLHNAFDVPMDVLLKDDAVAQKRENRVAMQQEMVRRENEAHSADVAQKESKANLNNKRAEE